ncbi:MAG: hypothetical protein K6B41_00580 [Butyrivibrio sp.]|nr:hypothetical protein [Butyrivibrio sp.]
MHILPRGIQSGDAWGYLLPWYDEIKEAGGWNSLNHQVGNYNIPYQILIIIGTYLPLNPLTYYKLLSGIFDFILALSVATLVKELTNHKYGRFGFVLVYSIILIIPTVFLNSAVWAQCDSMYSSFVVLTVLSLYKEQYKKAFIFCGFAFAMKLQAIFVVPLIIYLYLTRKNFTILHFLLIPIPNLTLNIPAYFYGRSPLDTLSIYLEQTDTFKQMTIDCDNFWMFSELGSYDHLSGVAIGYTLILLGTGLLLILRGGCPINDRKFWTADKFMLLCVWSMMTTIFFLPAMHERYTYLLDVLLFAAAFTDKRLFKVWFAEAMVSYITYARYLFGTDLVKQIPSAVNMVCWFYLTCSSQEK